jgi:Domain of unknown function (DUF4333)
MNQSKGGNDVAHLCSRVGSAIPGGWLGRLLAGGALVTASVSLAACGSSGAPTILNTEKVEQAIEQSSLAQRGQRAHASCPAGVNQKQGLSFSCTAVVKGVSTQFRVTQLDGAGHVHYVAR